MGRFTVRTGCFRQIAKKNQDMKPIGTKHLLKLGIMGALLGCMGPARSLQGSGAAAPPAHTVQGDRTVAPGREIVVEGSTTVEPIATRFAENFTAEHSDVRIRVKSTDSREGAQALIRGRCDIACMSRFMTDGEFRAAVDRGVHPVFHVVAIDGIAFVVHPDNPVGAASLDQLRRIFSGAIRNWMEVGGEDMPIVVIGRTAGSATREFFNSAVMKGDDVKASESYDSNAAVRARVLGTPGAIGFVGLSFLKGLKVVAVDGIQASPETVAAGNYPISRPLFMVTNGYPEPGSAVLQMVTMQQRPCGREIVADCGFVPVEEYRKPTARQVVREYWPWFTGGAFLTLLALLVAVYTARLNARLRAAVAALADRQSELDDARRITDHGRGELSKGKK
jgi:phosphate transport system substrate-binding protein